MKARDRMDERNIAKGTSVYRIFIVDDHPIMRRGYSALISREPDLEVCGEAGSGEEAIEQILKESPDLVIADISMDGMNGSEMIKHLKSLRPELPFLVVSMHDETLYAERALHAGASGYIMKSEVGSMRYVVKQRVFSFGDNFTIKDEAGNDCFVVKGKVFTFGDKLSMYDMYGQELVYIEQRLFRFLPEYSIYYRGQLYATVKKEFTFFKPRFRIHSTMAEYSAEGNLWGMDFSILRNGKLVALVSKKWFAWSDTYGVDIIEDEDPVFILALVIVIDQVIHDGNHNNS